MFKKFKANQITQQQLANIKGGTDPNNCKELKDKDGSSNTNPCTTEDSGSSGGGASVLTEIEIILN